MITAGEGSFQTKFAETQPQPDTDAAASAAPTSPQEEQLKKEEQLTGERLRTLVFEENERLNRLIRNLYLKFRLDRYPESELFDHICRELAQYFHADVCSLLLRRWQTAEKDGGLKPHLELVGAFGPWQEALHPTNTRKKQVTSYDLEDFEPITPRAYHREVPTLTPSRQQFELMRRIGSESTRSQGQQAVSGKELARHLVWHYTNLYSTCRNMIIAPIMRQPESGLPALGLLKIENRTPRGIQGFSRSAGSQQLFFKDLWALAALQPYLIDLHDNGQDVFAPVHDNEAWRLRYQDSPLGLEYFDSLRDWLKKKQADLEGKSKEENEREKEGIRKSYEQLRDDLSGLLRFLTEAETLLQNIAYAHTVLFSEERTRHLHLNSPPAPSFYNAHNLARALRKAESEYTTVNGAIADIENQSKFLQRFKEKLVEVGATFAPDPSARQNPDSPQLIQKVMNKVVGREALPKDIALLLDRSRPDAPVKWNVEAAAWLLLECIQEFAKAISTGSTGEAINLHLGPPDLAQARIVVEQKLALRLAEEIRGRDITESIEQKRKETQQWVDFEAAWLERKAPPDEARLMSHRHQVTAAEATLLLLSDWSASVSMNAHTFSETDAYRLMFIAGHVCQVLDNNLMQQARQRGIPVGYSDFALLGLDRDSLEWLNAIQTCAAQTAQTLTHRINRDLRREGLPSGSFICLPLDLSEDLLGPLRNAQEDIRDARNSHRELRSSTSDRNVKMRLLRIGESNHLIEALLVKKWTGNVSQGVVKNPPYPENSCVSLSVSIPLPLIAKSEPAWMRLVHEALDEFRVQVALND
jgi:hypothetical protein